MKVYVDPSGKGIVVVPENRQDIDDLAANGLREGGDWVALVVQEYDAGARPGDWPTDGTPCVSHLQGSRYLPGTSTAYTGGAKPLSVWNQRWVDDEIAVPDMPECMVINDGAGYATSAYEEIQNLLDFLSGRVGWWVHSPLF